jgi:hypothetical protein
MTVSTTLLASNQGELICATARRVTDPGLSTERGQNDVARFRVRFLDHAHRFGLPAGFQWRLSFAYSRSFSLRRWLERHLVSSNFADAKKIGFLGELDSVEPFSPERGVQLFSACRWLGKQNSAG